MNHEERIQAIRERLTAALSPQILEVVNESQHHVGHAGASTGMGHYALKIQSPAFKDISMVQQHRLIYEALGSLMETDIHALRITII